MADAWKFVVLGACFSINLLELGTYKSFGVFFFPMEGELNVSGASLGLCMTIALTMGYLLGPIINRVAKSTGERFMIGIGGVVVGTGLVMSSFAVNIVTLGLFFSIAGVGYGMAFTPTMPVIDLYFNEQNANTAMGFMVTGGAVGMMIVPPVAESLIDEYGWRGGMLILGAVNANIIVCAALIRPNRTNYYTLNLSDEENLNGNDSQRESPECSSHFYKIRDEFLMLFKPLKVPTFNAIVAAMFFEGAIFASWAIFLVPHAIIKGLVARQAVYLSALGGIGSIFGKICPGPFIDKTIITGLQLAILLEILNALSFFMDPLSNSFVVLSALAFVNGFATGANFIAVFASCKEILGDDAVDGFIVLSVTYAVGELAGGVITGHLLDVGINSAGGFMILGGFALVAALMYAVPVLTSFVCGTEPRN